MGRVLIASIVGALIVFMWGFIAWPTLSLFGSAFPPLPDENAVVLNQLTKPGAYVFPGMIGDPHNTAVRESWTARHKQGPVGMVLFNPQGSDPDSPMMLARGFAIYFIACLLMSCIMVGARMQSFPLRFGLAIMMAAFAVMISHGANNNWFHLPNGYTTALALDVMIGWSLAGFVVAMIVKSPPGPA